MLDRARQLRAMFARLKEAAAGGGARRPRGPVTRKSEARSKDRAYAVRRAPKKASAKRVKKRNRRGVRWRTMTEGV